MKRGWSRPAEAWRRPPPGGNAGASLKREVADGLHDILTPPPGGNAGASLKLLQRFRGPYGISPPPGGNAGASLKQEEVATSASEYNMPPPAATPGPH